MDKQYIEDNEIGIKYLRGQLGDDELAEFETYLMDNPELLDQLAIDDILATEGGLSITKINDTKPTFFKRPVLRFTQLASVAAALFISFTFISFDRGSKDFELYTVRGPVENSVILRLTIGQKLWPFSSKIRLNPQVDGSKSYSRVVLERLNPSSQRYQLVDSELNFKTLSGGEVSIPVELAQLVRGEYKLTLRQDYIDREETKTRDWLFMFTVE